MSGIAVLWVAVDRDASHSVCFLHALAVSSDPLRTKSPKPKTKKRWTLEGEISGETPD